MSITIGTYTIKNIPSFFSFTGKKGKREKKYEKTNHLGNVTVVISDRKVPVDEDNDGTVDGFRVEVRSSTDYYPFGMVMPGRNFNSMEYRFGYGGHEKVDEVSGSGNIVDMSDRWLDVRLGRTPKPDPYATAYPGISPYAYALNTPIQAVDPDGNLVIFVNGYHMGLEGVIGIFGNASLTDVGKRNYWGGLDDKFSERIRDNNRYYSDGGTRTAWSTAQERYNQGKKEGKTMLEKINSGDIKIKVDENGKPIETIKIVSHSQGSARAAGISNVLTEAGYTVEVEYNIAPKQPGDITETNADRTVQYGSDEDFIAPQSPMSNAGEQYELKDEGKPYSSGGGHKVEQYDEVLDIPKGQKGYVAPRKDKPKPKQNGMGTVHFLLLLSIFFGSCKTRKGQIRCITHYVESIRLTEEYQKVREAAKVTVTSWEKMDIWYAEGLRNSNWRIGDIVLFNSSKKRVILFLLKIDKNTGAVLDFNQMLAAEKKEGIWYIYSSMPTMGFNRKDHENGRAYTYEELSEGILPKILKGGLLKKGWSCEIDDAYINGWFDGKKDLVKQHQKFLKDTIQ